jgi:tRNA(fMet)-specific endonuclease VapC
MSTYLLDTNICVYLLKNAYSVDTRLRAVGIRNCYISEMTLAELEFGVENSSSPYKMRQRTAFENFAKTFVKRTLPIRPCFTFYAQQKAKLRQSGQIIGDFDLLIGASSVVGGHTMVTENVGEFSRIDGIQIENWVIRPTK